jgi:hypothetical protein
MTAGALIRARSLVSRGQDEAAKLAYLEVLQADPVHCGALTELGALAHASGFVSAALEAYRQAAKCHPGSKVAHVGCGYLLSEAGDAAAACVHYRSALAIDPDLHAAHQGLARALTELGESAEEHWRKGFGGHAIIHRRYRGAGTGIPLLMLVAAVGGNIPTTHWVDDRIFAVTALYADFFDPSDLLPPHAMILNAIGDAELCGTALANADRIAMRCSSLLINQPGMVRATGRAENADRLGRIAGVIAPRTAVLSQAGDFRYPLLLRTPGYHTGQHFVRVETPEGLASAVASLPRAIGCDATRRGEPLAIEYLDARGADGMARKYRVMFIGGVAYPLHLAISADWKVHYFTAAMAGNAEFREQERRFLDAMPSAVGPRAMAALAEIQATLGLDYAGIDFAVAADGSLLLFEANATMAIIPLDPDPMWDYRRRAVNDALAAARRLLPRYGLQP